MGKKTATIQVLIALGVLAWPLVVCGADANLMGWWKFDGNGSDSSGNGRDGTLVRDAHYEAGYAGQALALDGDGDGFTVTGYKGLLSDSPVTVSAWVKTAAADDRTMVYWGRNSGGRRVDFRLGAGRLRVEHGSGNLQGNTALNNDEWHHVALTMPAAAPISYPEVKLYLDGRDDSQNTRDPEGDKFNLATHANNVDLTIGYRVPNADRYFLGRIDEVRLYNRELTAVEIKDLATYGYVASACNPSIPDGSQFENPWANLTWTPGALATYHNVYFGTSFADVNTGVPSALVGKVTGNSQMVGVTGFPVPDGLLPGQTYYWRVDAVNESNPASPWRGQVWSFWVPEKTAYRPFPADGAPFEDTNTVLSWMPGLRAALGTVYFGTDPNQVAQATGGTPRAETTYNPGPLQAGKTYCWRVDTFNGAEWITGKVWSFTTITPIPLTADPNLVAWWPMDEGAGTRIVDRSGHGRHGRFNPAGSPTWVPGCDGTALSFEGAGSADSVAAEGYTGILGTNPFTITAWVKATDTGDRSIVSWGSGPAGQRVDFRLYLGRLRVEHGNGNLQGSTALNDGEWHHAACVVRRDAAIQSPDISLYLDGADDTYVTVDPDKFDIVAGVPVTIGRRGTHSDREFLGLIDDVRLFDKALTLEEIEMVLRVDPLRAWKPEPRTGSTLDIRTLPPLTWSKGDNAAKHDVYFGTDAAAVTAANASDTAGIYRSRISATSFMPKEDLAWGQKYFWRVDEVGADGTLTVGKVWALTVADYLTIENFDSYTDATGNEIFTTWIDGFSTQQNGSTVGNTTAPFAERAVIYDGTQAMPMDYNNIKAPFYSEAERELVPAQNWTVHGVGTLVLYVQGVASNVAGPLYVGVRDSAGGTAKFVHPNPEVVRQTGWQRWDIALADISKAGVNLKSIKAMFVGVGDRDRPQAGGTGRIYVDAIRLVIAPKPQ
jgi:hypothetical protein